MVFIVEEENRKQSGLVRDICKWILIGGLGISGIIYSTKMINKVWEDSAVGGRKILAIKEMPFEEKKMDARAKIEMSLYSSLSLLL